jgi:hypothetical protein
LTTAKAPVAIAPTKAKAETTSPFWCDACGYADPTCPHRVIEVVRSTPTGAVLTLARVALDGRDTCAKDGGG